jgi:lipopolysaccharide transport system ATP-binding protein
MSDIAIRVEGLSKQYRIGGKQERYRTLRDTIADTALAPYRRFRAALRHSGVVSANGDETIWALKDVSFEVKRGEVVGIIGRNGSGKSTLLKILSRITSPTAGCADIHGRVGSLLEVGTGFHAELTGRDNIYLNGAILGMKRAEIERRFDEIVAFSEVEKFIDTPVKYYSSGMYLRLAFGVAAHLDPEILLVDEVLAVGDASFQKKCLGKMEDVSNQGRTVLFVSHNMTALQRLCERAIWLDQGRKQAEGDARPLVSRYLQSNSSITVDHVWDDPEKAPGNEKVRLHRVRIVPADGDETELTVRTPFKMEFEYWNYMPGAILNLSPHIYNLEETCVFNSGSEARSFPAGLVRGVCYVPGNLLNDSTYRVHLMIVKDTSVPIFNHHNIAQFEVKDVEREGHWYGKWIGAVRPQLEWTHEWIGAAVPPSTERQSKPFVSVE